MRLVRVRVRVWVRVRVRKTMVILTAHLSDRSMVRSTSALVSQGVRVRVTVRPNTTLPLPP